MYKITLYLTIDGEGKNDAEARRLVTNFVETVNENRLHLTERDQRELQTIVQVYNRGLTNVDDLADELHVLLDRICEASEVLV